MAESDDDKNFEPSPQKLQRLREQGDLPNLPELNTLAMYLAAGLALQGAGVLLVPRWIVAAGGILGGEGWSEGTAQAAARNVAGFAALGGMALVALPALGIALVLGLGRRIVFVPGKLAPDLGRINLAKTGAQKFGRAGLMAFFASLTKAALVMVAGLYLFAGLWAGLATGHDQVSPWMTDIARILSRVLGMATGISLVFAAIDLWWKHFEHRRKHRMTLREIRDEHKEAEGDPHLKAARRQRAIEIAMKQMLADVAKADVVIVNPTHFAVALQWQRGSGRAPVCLAKGVDEVAARIRERAREHKVPIWSDPPCARALHGSIEIGQEIRRDQFAAVATAIRFAEAMRQKARAGW